MRKDIDRDAQRVERHWNEFRAKRGSDSPIKLADAQFFVAREHGFASWPRFASHLEVIKALLEHGADVHARENDLYHADPLGWALIRWSGCSGARYKERYVQAVALLVAAGATFDPAWYEQDETRRNVAAKIESDRRMQARCTVKSTTGEAIARA